MRSAVGRILLQLTAGLAVVAGTFWITLNILHYSSMPVDPNAAAIHVTEATYGENCQSFVPRPGHTNLAKPGNATAAVAQACNMAKGSCMFAVDVSKLGDPADGCGKDFVVGWRCGADPTVHEVFLPAEASGATALVTCQSW